MLEGDDVGINIPSLHNQFAKLVVSILLLGGVLPGILKGSGKFGPEDGVCLSDKCGLGGVGACSEVCCLGVDPIIDQGSSDIGEGSEDAVEGDSHGRVGSIVQLVAAEF